MNSRQIYTGLRTEAQKELGVKVFRPKAPDALFVCSLTPERSGPLFSVFPGKDGRFRADLTQEGTRFLFSLLPASIPVPEPQGENAVLLTVAARCMKSPPSVPAGKAAVLALHCLAFSERERLQRELPGLIALALRERKAPEKLAGLLIMNELYYEEENDHADPLSRTFRV